MTVRYHFFEFRLIISFPGGSKETPLTLGLSVFSSAGASLKIIICTVGAWISYAGSADKTNRFMSKACSSLVKSKCEMQTLLVSIRHKQDRGSF